MTAGSPHGTTTVTADHQADRIARLFAEGHGIDFVCERGFVAHPGWTRARVLEIVAQRGWTLDASGRVPREQRPAVTPGQPVPRQPSGVTQVGVIGGRPPVSAPKAPPSPGRAQVAVLVEQTTPANAPGKSRLPAPASVESAANAPKPPARDLRQEVAAALPLTPPTPAPTVDAARIDQLPLHDLLEQAAGHDSDRVRLLADRARETIADIRAVLTADTERAVLRAELAALEVRRDVLLAKLAEPLPVPVDGPQRRRTDPPTADVAADDGERPINHGTWGGFLAHRYRKETVAHIEAHCPPCFAAKATRGRKATA